MIESNDFLSFSNDVFIENNSKKNKDSENLSIKDLDVNIYIL